MGLETPISWCDSTLNLEMGCNGCELWNPLRQSCYAGVATAKYAGRKGWPKSFEQPEVFPWRIDEGLKWSDLTGQIRPSKPWLNGYPRIIFLDDMGDTWTEGLPYDWLAQFLPQMAASKHLWLPLTKRPARAAAFFTTHGIPTNMWIGTSVTDQRSADARIPQIVAIDASVRFVSCEPLLGPIDLTPWIDDLDWAIIGGESGLGIVPKRDAFRPMDPGWAVALRDQCATHGVPFFFKQSSAERSERVPFLEQREHRGMPKWPSRR